MKQKKIVLVSSGQPSLNPRLVKEADALADAGFNVTVIYAYWNDWGTKYDVGLLSTKKWKTIRAGGHPQQARLTYLLSRFIQKAVRLLSNAAAADFALARSSYFLIREAKKHQADLYIGHNLGALPAIVKAAKRHGVKCGFDAEDFHRQELSDDSESAHFKAVKYIEDKYLGDVNYLTVSSSMIGEAYQQLYTGIKTVVIHNVFPKSEHLTLTANTGPVKLFWFSQTVGPGRGLEVLVEALNHLNYGDFELHLLGAADATTKARFIEQVKFGQQNLIFHDPVSPDELVAFAAQFDIGLASENNTPRNRDICLTNKIFTYLQAGLAIVASDTTSQRAFIAQYPAVGMTYKTSDPDSLATVLLAYQSDKNLLLQTRAASLKSGQVSLNWELESVKFLDLITQTLKQS